MACFRYTAKNKNKNKQKNPVSWGFLPINELRFWIISGVTSYRSHNFNLYCVFHENIPEPKYIQWVADVQAPRGMTPPLSKTQAELSSSSSWESWSSSPRAGYILRIVSRTLSSRSSTVGTGGAALLMLLGAAHYPDRLDRNLPMAMVVDDIEELSRLEQSAVMKGSDDFEKNSSGLKVVGFSGGRMLESFDRGPESLWAKNFWFVIRSVGSDGSSGPKGSEACVDSEQSESSNDFPKKS